MSNSIDELDDVDEKTSQVLLPSQVDHVQISTKTTLKQSCKKISPLLMVSAAGVIFCTQAVLSKLMPVPPGQFVLTESAFNLPFSLIVCFHTGVNVSPFQIRDRKLWFWGRVIFGGLASGAKILVIGHMNIGDATAIIFTAPIWSGCLARILLKEKYTLVNLFATIFGLVGVILVTKPEFLFPDVTDRGESSLEWACATFGVSILAAVSYVCVRGAGESVHPMKLVLYTAFVEFISGFLINLVMKQSLVLPPCDWVRATLLLCGFGATAGNLLIVRGLSLENTGPATLMRNGDIVFAYVCQVVFFKITPDWMSILGATLIVGTAFLQAIDILFDISRGIVF